MKSIVFLIVGFLFNISARAELSYGDFSPVSSRPQPMAFCEEKSVQNELDGLASWMNVPGPCSMINSKAHDLTQIRAFLTRNYRACSPSDRQVLDKALFDIANQMKELQGCVDPTIQSSEPNIPNSNHKIN